MPNYELKTPVRRSILINSDLLKVWNYLTDPDLMKSWMGDEEMEIEVISDWKVGGAITIKAFHHVHFENKGTILQLEAGKIFQYEYLSSLSNLEDQPGNYTTITFSLTQKVEQTELKVEVKNFPTFEIYKHLEFYWNGTLKIIQLKIEKSKNTED